MSKSTPAPVTADADRAYLSAKESLRPARPPADASPPSPSPQEQDRAAEALAPVVPIQRASQGQQVDAASALKYELQAADQAAKALAFEQAAKRYLRCLELAGDSPDPDLVQIYRRYAMVLGRSGRDAQAAEAYREAARLSPGEGAQALLRLAASHLLRSGQLDAGEDLLRHVLDATGFKMPTTRRGLATASTATRLQWTATGLTTTPRWKTQVPGPLLDRIDALGTFHLDTLPSDPTRSRYFLAQQVRWALRAGEPARVLAALCGVCNLNAERGTAGAKRTVESLLIRIDALAHELDTPVGYALAASTRASALWMVGDPEGPLPASREAERLYRTTVAGSLHDSHQPRLTAAAVRMGCLLELGDYRAVGADLLAMKERGSMVGAPPAAVQLAVIEATLDGIQQRHEAAAARLHEQRATLPNATYGLNHAKHMIASCVTAHGDGDYARGLSLLDQAWPRFVRSHVRHIAMTSCEAHATRLQLMMSHFLVHSKDPALARALRREVRVLAKLRMQRRAAPAANLQLARLLASEGDVERAVCLLQTAIGVAKPDERERARFLLGRLIGGDQGAELCHRAERFFANGGVVDPRAYLQGCYPERH